MEYFCEIHVLTPFFLAPMSCNITLTFIVLHLESNDFFLLFLKYYKPNQNLELSFDSFKLTFQCMSHLFASDNSRMISEHLQDYFHP
jgi:hypothetical protein